MENQENKTVLMTKENSFLKFTFKNGKIVYYDFKTNKYFSYTGNEIQLSTIKSIFNKNSNNIIDENSNEKYKKLFYIILNDNYRSSTLGYCLSKLYKYQYTENLIMQGFKVNSCISRTYFNNFIKLPKNIKNIFKVLDIDICNYCSAIMYLSNNSVICNFIYELYLYLLDDLEYFKSILSDLNSSYRLDILNQLLTQFNYNIKSLIKYLYSIERYEALSFYTAIGYLKDYINSKYIVLGNISKIDKYPKYLHTAHDIAVKYLNLASENFNEDLFKLQKETFKKLDKEFKDTIYSVIYPNNTSEIKKEGVSLNHCVASYIKDVLLGKCHILFLRKTSNLNESLITLEIKQGSVVQASGYLNRALTKEEYSFLEKYCKFKKFELKTKNVEG